MDFLPGTPEQNLAYHLTRSARFGARYAVRFRIPVMGTWVVTQAEDDGPTHQGAWKHALDLEVRGPDDRLHRGDGAQLADWFCYRLPVLAPADGTVVTVIDGVRDNPVGHVDLEDNWGNVVVIWHGPGLYSMVAHLSPGTIEVHEGAPVRRGDVLGRCGSSGRSPHPHLHFQLQGSPVVGAPTIPTELHDVVDVDSGALRTTWSPKTGARLRNLEVDPDLAEALALRPGSHWTWVDGDRETRLDIGVDALGVPAITHRNGRLVYAAHDDLLTLFAPLAPQRSPLHVLRAAMARIPFEPGLSWVDPLPPAATVPRLLRPLWDLAAPFVGWTGTPVHYHLTSDGSDWTVTGRTTDRAITTHVRISRDRGPTELARTVRRQTTRLLRAPPQTPDAQDPPSQEAAR